MPTATKFEAEGVDNGFPSCLSDVNVTSYDHWTTFSGVNKDNVGSFTPEQLEVKIKESLELAMKLRWNGYSLDALSTGTYNGSTFTVEDIDISSSTYSEPKSRVCGFAGASLSDNSVTEGSANLNIFFGNPSRLINSGVFVGYGYGPSFNLAVSNARTATFRAEVILTGAEETEESPTSVKDIDYDYVELNGINFLCKAEARVQFSSASKLADATNLTATASYSGINTVDLEASITADGLDFYTYPA